MIQYQMVNYKPIQTIIISHDLLVAILSKILVLIFFAALVSGAADEFVFNGFSGANLSLTGFAEITANGLLRLTNDTKEALGHAFYPLPFNFKKPLDGDFAPSFSNYFVFAIQPEYPDVSGHGIAFALSPSNDLPGSMPSQNLGLLNTTDNGSPNNHIIAVELDTVKTVEFNDINDNHIAIDVNSLISLNSSPTGYFESKSDNLTSLMLISGSPMQVWIDYNGFNMQLDVKISPINKPKPVVSLVSSRINISSIVRDVMYVGFSASTGAATGWHYILGWSFSLNGTAQPLDLSKLPKLPQQDFNKKPQVLLPIALPLVLVIFLLLSIGLIMVILRRRKKFEELHEDWEIEYVPHRLSYKDLFIATKGFSEENLIGAGGFGRVYRGVMPGSRNRIAVKKVNHDSKQGTREFINEIASLSRLRQRNLVQLLGYCRRRGELLLVYEYMSNGSLDKLLFNNNVAILSWNQRFGIIKGVASGLLYLHEGWEQVVVHRDIKASNVLLDDDLNGKLGDFGLARLYDHGTNPQTTHIVGTFGYLAPELVKTGKATTSTDVYAFGAFLLEVACGRRPTEVDESVDVPVLVDLVREYWKTGRILEMRDVKLGFDYVEEEVELVLKLGLLCSNPDAPTRPSMRQVMQFLEGNVQLLDSLIGSENVSRYDDSFDDFVMSCASPSESSYRKHRSSIFFSSH